MDRRNFLASALGLAASPVAAALPAASPVAAALPAAPAVASVTLYGRNEMEIGYVETFRFIKSTDITIDANAYHDLWRADN